MNRKIGIIYAAAAYALWGLLPLFWKLFTGVSSFEVLAHRITWSAAFAALLLTLWRQWSKVRLALSNKRGMGYLALCAALIAVNWATYIWSVRSGHVVDASMGYYINPLVSVLLGVLVMKEKLNRFEYASVGLAAFGVLFLGLSHGSVPWIALILASTFASYGLLKKIVGVDSLAGLFIESAILAPLTLLYLGGKQLDGTGSFGPSSWYNSMLFVVSGVVTGVPLLWFAKASQVVELSMMGFLLYITPTLTLLIGVFVFGEPFTFAHAVCFGCIWTAIAVYSLSKAGILRVRR